MNKQGILFLLATILIAGFLLFFRLDSVDLEASEDIYLADAIGYIRGDLYIVPRHHLRKPHFPASPHPFLFQHLATIPFKLFGISLTTARMVPAIATLVSVIALIILGCRLAGYQLGTLSGLIFILFPLVTRYGRMAILDPLLTVIQILGMLWLCEVVTQQRFKGYVFAALVGMAWGMSSSTKLTGIFFSIPILLLFGWYFLKTRQQYFIIAFSICVFVAVVIFFLFNDPYSYYFAWTHFSDPKHQNITLSAILKAFTTARYWFYFITGLFGVIPFGLLLHALVQTVKRTDITSKQAFLAAWILAPLTYLVLNPIHITGLSAEWSYLPIIAPLSIIIAHILLNNIRSRLENFSLIYWGYFIFTMPFVLLYGLRLQPLPLASFLHARNVVWGDLAVASIIKELNTQTASTRVLVVTKGIDFPLWMLRDTIITEPPYHDFSWYDYIVTDNKEIVQQSHEHFFEVLMQSQNNGEPIVYLLKRV